MLIANIARPYLINQPSSAASYFKPSLKFGRGARYALLLVLLAVMTGCSDDDNKGSDTQPGTVARLFTYPEIRGCQTCHSGSEDGPDLSQASFSTSLVDTKQTDFYWTAPTITQTLADCGQKYSYVKSCQCSKGSKHNLNNNWHK